MRLSSHECSCTSTHMLLSHMVNARATAPTCCLLSMRATYGLTQSRACIAGRMHKRRCSSSNELIRLSKCKSKHSSTAVTYCSCCLDCTGTKHGTPQEPQCLESIRCDLVVGQPYVAGCLAQTFSQTFSWSLYRLQGNLPVALTLSVSVIAAQATFM